MAYATVCVFESVALPTAIEYLFPSIRLGTLWTVLGAPVSIGFVAIGITAAVVMTWINVIGIRAAALVQSVITATVLIAGILLIVGAVSFGSLANAEPPIATPATGILTVLIMVPAMMVGFDVIPQSAEEINLPSRRIGWLLVLSLLMAVLWYGAVACEVSMALDPTALESTSMATADAATSLWNGRWAGTVLIVGGVGGILTSWNAFIIGGSRVMFALSESGFLPASFSRLHPRYKTPYVGIWVLGLMASISPFFGRTILVWLVDTGSFAVVIAYIFVPIAFLVLRRKQPDLDRPFRVRYPSLVGVVAVVLGLVLLSFYFPWSPSSLIWPYEWGIALGWALLGLVCWLFRDSRTN